MEEMKELQQYGLGGVIAMALIKLLDYLSRKSENRTDKEFEILTNSINELMEILKNQNEGLIDQREVVREQTKAIREQTKAITILYTEAKLNSQALNRVAQDVAEIRNTHRL